MKPSEQQDTAVAHIKAATLIESLDWLKQFHGKTVVIKFGGNAMVDQALQQAFAQDVAYLRWVGIKPVVVHGGGPQISARLNELGLESEFRGGFRVTNSETVQIVRDVLRDQIGTPLAALINAQGAKARVMSGEDSNLFLAERIPAEIDGVPVDIGLVGEVIQVNPRIVFEALDSGEVPVISTVAPSATGELLNVNADLAAAALAVALGAEVAVELGKTGRHHVGHVQVTHAVAYGDLAHAFAHC